MSMITCSSCGAHVDSDFHDVYFNDEYDAFCEACEIKREAPEECIDCGEVNPRGRMQGACYMNCSKGAAR